MFPQARASTNFLSYPLIHPNAQFTFTRTPTLLAVAVVISLFYYRQLMKMDISIPCQQCVAGKHSVYWDVYRRVYVGMVVRGGVIPK